MLLLFQSQTVGRRIELSKKKIEFLIISRLVLNIEILFTILNNYDIDAAMKHEKSIYIELKKRLTLNEFRHGTKLRAEILRKEFECSASTVREILFRLATQGLVKFQEQRGFRVPEMSPAKLIELTHMRILLEGEGAVLSIRQGGVGWEAQLSAAHHKLSHLEKRIHSLEDSSELVELWFSSETEFHQTLISACGSTTLKQMHSRIYSQFRQQLMEADRRFDFMSDNIKQHSDILDAALAADEALTRKRIHDHLGRHLTGRTASPSSSN